MFINTLPLESLKCILIRMNLEVYWVRILYVSQFYFPYIKGGAEISLAILAENLSTQHNVWVFTIDPSNDSHDSINNVFVVRKHIPWLSHFLFEDLQNKKKINSLKARVSIIFAPYHKKLLKELEETINKFNPDIIHINNAVGFPLSKIYQMVRRRGKRVIQSIRDNFLLGTTSTGKRVPFWFRYINSVLSEADVVHFPSKTIMEKYGKQIKTEKIYIPNTVGIDFNEEKWNEFVERKKDDSVKKIAYVGVLEKHKGVHLLCEWFEDIYKALNNNVELIFVGDGSLRDFIENQLKKHIKNGTVKITGWIPRDEVDKILQESHFVILPSQWEEAFGRILIEGYYNGCLPIGSSWGAIPEVVGDKSLVFNNKKDLIKTLQFHSKTNNWYQKMMTLKEHMLQFSLSNHIKKFEQLYKILLK